MHISKYLQILVNQIHSVVIATVNDEGLPITCVIDMMLVDDEGVYFLTAKGKSFYERLVKHPEISLTGLSGESTMTSQSISMQAKVKEIGQRKLDEIFAKNPYMNEIYPTTESRSALTVFQIYEGKGEYFDLSQKPIFRETFTLGKTKLQTLEYVVSSKCIGCLKCSSVCPQQCIDVSQIPVKIQSEHCLHCGKCIEVCPHHAISRRLV